MTGYEVTKARSSHKPAILIHGIGPRSGTNYLSDILTCHNDVETSPRGLWELPFLTQCDSLCHFADQLESSPKVLGVKRCDLLAAFGSGMLALAHQGLNDATRVLIKEPSVAGIEHFFEFFPQAHLVILVRDGRDLATSLRRTRFGDLPIRRYRRLGAALGVLPPLVTEYAKRWRDASNTIWRATSSNSMEWKLQCTVVRFEDLVQRTESVVAELLARLQLLDAGFNWSAVKALPIKGSSFAGRESSESLLNWEGVVKGTTVFDPVGRWRDWPERELAAYHRVAGAELERWGYSLSR